MNKAIFEKYITDNFPQNREYIIGKFEEYLTNLLEINQYVNLVSRKTSEEDYWTKHFLDSILPCRQFDLSNKKILDFGTGGGMPGIPLKIIFPSATVHLLDSKTKKIVALKKIIKKLDLSECFTIVSRIEELGRSWDGKFDLIVCRSVKMLPKYRDILLRLLGNNGEILFYKSSMFDDMEVFRKFKVLDLTHEAIGERRLIQIKKKWEGYE